MLTRNQLLKNSRSSFFYYKSKTPALRGNPQKCAEVLKFFTRSPKKPNSAIRKVAKVTISYLMLFQNKFALQKKEIFLDVEAYVAGEGGHDLKPKASVLVRGGRVPDLPGVRYHLIRGKYNFSGLIKRKTSRSQYGAKFIKLKKVVEKKK